MTRESLTLASRYVAVALEKLGALTQHQDGKAADEKALTRSMATLLVAVISVTLSGFPDLIEDAQRWITHLGNLGAPLAGVVLADYLVVKKQLLDVDALFDPRGRYRYVKGVNVSAVLAIAGAVAVYYLASHSWLKVVVGVATGAALYLALVAVQAPARRFEATSDSRPAA